MDPASQFAAVAVASLAKSVAGAVAKRGADFAWRKFRDDSWCGRLADGACQAAGVSSASGAVATWLKREETKASLIAARDEAAATSLVNSLSEALEADWSGKVALDAEKPNFQAAAGAILEQVLGQFLAELEPSEGIAVLDARAEARHVEVLATLDTKERRRERFEDVVGLLPPIAQQSLRRLDTESPVRAEALAGLVGDPDAEPAARIRQIFLGPEPSMFHDSPASFWVALADLASVYGHRDLELQCIDAALDRLAPHRAVLLVRAAIAIGATGDTAAALSRLSNAEGAADTADIQRLVHAVAASMRGDHEEVVEVSDGMPPFIDGIPVALYRAVALGATNRRSEAIALLREAVQQQPRWSGILIWLANLLVAEAEESPQGDRARRLRAEAMEIASRARGVRLAYRGPSWEALDVMVRIAMAMNDRRLALRLTDPHIDATAAEAAASTIIELRAALLLDVGDVGAAKLLIDQLESPFHRLLVTSAIAREEGRLADAEADLRQALDLARHEGERVVVIRAMATAGVRDIPDLAELAERDPDFVAILTASSAMARQEFADAIATLRPIRRSSARYSRMLAIAYKDSGDSLEAIRELLDASAYFREPELTALAALIAEEAELQDQARNLAERAILMLPADSPAVPQMRILLYDAHMKSREWSEAEEQARRLLELEPVSSGAGWGLVNSLAAQLRLREAWETICDKKLAPRSEDEARLWIQLAAREIALRSWLSTALELVVRFPDSEALHAVFLMATVQHPDPELSAELGERITVKWREFIERFPESTILTPRTVGQTDEEVIEALRDWLEPRHEEAEEQARAVDDGRLPLGIAATVGRGPYLQTWIVGGTGSLHIYLPLAEINEMELAAAIAGVDKGVVLDGSTLAVASVIPAIGDLVLSSFSRTFVPMSLRADAVHTTDRLEAPSEGLLGWDAESGRPRLTTFADEDVAAWRVRAHWIEARLAEATAIEVASLDHIPEADAARWWWLASLELAKREGVPLYCDDVWIRRVAASIGVLAFGTVDLLSVLVASGRLHQKEASDAVTTLRQHGDVTIPLSETELMSLAGSEGWEARTAARHVAQAVYWSTGNAVRMFERILFNVFRNRREALPDWVATGILGAGRAVHPDARRDVAGRMLATAVAAYGDAESVPRLVAAARVAAARIGSDDPLPAASQHVREYLLRRMPYQAVVAAMAHLTSKLAEADARILKIPLFTP